MKTIDEIKSANSAQLAAIKRQTIEIGAINPHVIELKKKKSCKLLKIEKKN